jgi:hypothetical protein
MFGGLIDRIGRKSKIKRKRENDDGNLIGRKRKRKNYDGNLKRKKQKFEILNNREIIISGYKTIFNKKNTKNQITSVKNDSNKPYNNHQLPVKNPQKKRPRKINKWGLFLIQLKQEVQRIQTSEKSNGQSQADKDFIIKILDQMASTKLSNYNYNNSNQISMALWKSMRAIRQTYYDKQRLVGCRRSILYELQGINFLRKAWHNAMNSENFKELFVKRKNNVSVDIFSKLDDDTIIEIVKDLTDKQRKNILHKKKKTAQIIMIKINDGFVIIDLMKNIKVYTIGDPKIEIEGAINISKKLPTPDTKYDNISENELKRYRNIYSLEDRNIQQVFKAYLSYLNSKKQKRRMKKRKRKVKKHNGNQIIEKSYSEENKKHLDFYTDELDDFLSIKFFDDKCKEDDQIIEKSHSWENENHFNFYTNVLGDDPNVLGGSFIPKYGDSYSSDDMIF